MSKLQSNGILAACDRMLGRVERLAAHLAGIGIVLLMLAGCAEVLLRSALGRPIPGVVDVIESVMVGVALLGMAYCQGQGGNVRMTLLISRFSGRTARLVDLFSYIVGLVFVCAVIYGAFSQLRNYLNLGGATPQLEIPLWIVACIVMVALVLLALRLLLQVVASVHMLLRPDAAPTGLPPKASEILPSE